MISRSSRTNFVSRENVKNLLHCGSQRQFNSVNAEKGSYPGAMLAANGNAAGFPGVGAHKQTSPF
jgi:hypothetical protein